MGYKGKFVQGEIPESGAIFMSNVKTKEECFKRKLFGLPSGMSDFVLHVKKGMTLFLFEFEKRLLYGVFRATCDGGIDIEPKAFRLSGKHFPAQVRFKTVWVGSPLAEDEFQDVIRDNYYSKKKFHFGLNEKQVSKLLRLFRLKSSSENHPERNIWSYDDKHSEGNARSGDLRKDIRHRIRFDSCDFRGDEVKVDDNMYISKHIIEARQTEKREGFLKHYTTESDEFGDYDRHDIPGKHLDHREKHIEDGYMSVFSKPHGNHLDEIGAGSSDFLMDGENKDILDYNRLQDEYKVRAAFRGSLNEHSLTNHAFSHFDQNAYLNCNPTRIDVPDFHLSPSRFDNESSYIPIANDCPFYPSPEKIPMSKPLPYYYSHDEGSMRYLVDPGLQSSIFPKFISRNLSSDAGLCMHEVDPTDNDKRFYEKHENNHTYGTPDKRVSVFSRLTSISRHEEQTFETDEKPELNASVDKVMKMLEKVVRSPKKRTGKSRSVIKQDDGDHSADMMIEDCEFPDGNLEVDADMVDEAIEDEGESVFQETRLVDFKRRNKSNKKIEDTSKVSSECLVGPTPEGPVETDQLTGMPRKRRKLLRPAFVEKNIIPDGASAHENTLPGNDRVSTKVVAETSEMVDAHEKTLPLNESISTKVVETSEMVDADENTLPRDDSISSKEVVETSKMVGTDENTLPRNNSISPKEVVETSKTVGTDENTIPRNDSISPKEVETSKTVDAHENALSRNDSISKKVVAETSEMVDASIKIMGDASLVPTCDEITSDYSNLTKAGIESSKKVEVLMKPIDLNMLPTCDECSPSNDNRFTNETSEKVNVSKAFDFNILPACDKSSLSKDDNNPTKPLLESLHMSTSECQKGGNEGHGSAGNRLVPDVFLEATPLASPKDEKMCGWIEW